MGQGSGRDTWWYWHCPLCLILLSRQWNSWHSWAVLLSQHYMSVCVRGVCVCVWMVGKGIDCDTVVARWHTRPVSFSYHGNLLWNRIQTITQHYLSTAGSTLRFATLSKFTTRNTSTSYRLMSLPFNWAALGGIQVIRRMSGFPLSSVTSTFLGLNLGTVG